MKFDFFTFGGRFFWEDVFNFQNWVIQHNIYNNTYRLLDNQYIRRDSGSFEECKNTLLKYIEAYELETPYTDSIILLHNFARSKFSWNTVSESLKDIKANIIAVNTATLKKDLNHQAKQLVQFLKNLDNSGHISFVTHGSGCLLLRKLLSITDNYRLYNIERVIDINPINSGSDLADLLKESRICQKILGPMLLDLVPQKAIDLAKLPAEIQHGIIFYAPAYTRFVKKLLERFESFPFTSPPSEKSYAKDIFYINKYRWLPLNDAELGKACLTYLTKGKFSEVSASNTTDSI